MTALKIALALTYCCVALLVWSWCVIAKDADERMPSPAQDEEP